MDIRRLSEAALFGAADADNRETLRKGTKLNNYVRHKQKRQYGVPCIKSAGEVLKLLENWRGASFADENQQTGFGEPGKGAPHGNENTCFAAHA